MKRVNGVLTNHSADVLTSFRTHKEKAVVVCDVENTTFCEDVEEMSLVIWL